LTGKWQLRQYIYEDGEVQKVDSVFFNFQKGSFLAICVPEEGVYAQFHGNYSMKGNELNISFLPDHAVGEIYEHFFGWPHATRTYNMEELSSSSMRLNHKDTISVFRKY